MRRLLLALALLSAPIVVAAQTPDTTYTTGPNQPNTTYPDYYTLTRRDTVMGYVLHGADSPYAGSCRAVWCALVKTAPTSWSQSGGTFASFSAAAREVVRVWNLAHPGDTLSTPPPPSIPDTTPSVPPVKDTLAYTTKRISPTPAGAVTAYEVWQDSTKLGTVVQAPAGRWTPRLPDGSALPVYTTLKAAALRLVDVHLHPPVVVPPADTTYRHVVITDTNRVHVTLTDTTHYKIVTADTVLMKPGETLQLQYGDTVKIPVRVIKADTVVLVKQDPTPGAPELPRLMDAMDAMLNASRAADTVTRRVYDLVGKTLVARLDAQGHPVCGHVVSDGKVEQMVYFTCPATVPAASP